MLHVSIFSATLNTETYSQVKKYTYKSRQKSSPNYQEVTKLPRSYQITKKLPRSYQITKTLPNYQEVTKLPLSIVRVESEL